MIEKSLKAKRTKDITISPQNIYMRNPLLRLLHILSLLFLLFLLIPHSAFGIGAPDAMNKQFVVVIDPGHGGKDPGAIGSKPSNREKDINLGIAKRLGELIQSNCTDTKVIFTRSTDVFIELGRRAEIANKAKADLFISIHTNAMPKGAKRAVGVQSYTLTLSTTGTNLEVEKRENSVIEFEKDGAKKYGFDGSTESSIMFELMQDRDLESGVEFAKFCQNEMVKTGKRHDMGVQQANLAVLRLTYMPSVLLEVGYISTPSEEAFLLSSSGQETMAKCIYNAFVRYKAQHTGRMSKLEQVTPVNTSQPSSSDETEEPSDSNSDNAEPSTTATPAVSQEQASPSSSQEKVDVPMFKIQLFVSDKKLKSNDRQFKGLSTDYYQEGKLYKYTYGNTSDYREIQRLHKSLNGKFPGSFIIAFVNGKKVVTSDAISQWKRNNKR
ncbi:MAG: N-acetylmuramoyl-L-alanine amidase [Bacteroidaceae bacterium]|nr:N-acetylmuramoyl-L-alanine amidase [Bacteroidaceae bacterium]